MNCRQPIEILLQVLKQRQARGGLTYGEAIMVDDLIAVVEEYLVRGIWPAETEAGFEGTDRNEASDTFDQ